MDLGKFLHSVFTNVANGTHTTEQAMAHPVVQMLQQMYAAHNPGGTLVPNDPNPPNRVVPGGFAKPMPVGLGAKLNPQPTSQPSHPYLPFIPQINNLPDYTTTPANYQQMFASPHVGVDQPILPHYYSTPVWQIRPATPTATSYKGVI